VSRVQYPRIAEQLLGGRLLGSRKRIVFRMVRLQFSELESILYIAKLVAIPRLIM
jgi:hypothetical protein